MTVLLIFRDEQRYKKITYEVTEFLQKECNFNSISFIPIDALNDVNIFRAQHTVNWYNGPHLIKLLNDLNIS